MEPTTKTSFDAPFNDWWVWLSTGAVIRTWGSVVTRHNGYVCFGGRTADDGRFVEMCGVPEDAVVGVRRGTNVNGLPRSATAPVMDDADRRWQAQL